MRHVRKIPRMPTIVRSTRILSGMRQLAFGCGYWVTKPVIASQVKWSWLYLVTGRTWLPAVEARPNLPEDACERILSVVAEYALARTPPRLGKGWPQGSLLGWR